MKLSEDRRISRLRPKKVVSCYLKPSIELNRKVALVELKANQLSVRHFKIIDLHHLSSFRLLDFQHTSEVSRR